MFGPLLSLLSFSNIGWVVSNTYSIVRLTQTLEQERSQVFLLFLPPPPLPSLFLPTKSGRAPLTVFQGTPRQFTVATTAYSALSYSILFYSSLFCAIVLPLLHYYHKKRKKARREWSLSMKSQGRATRATNCCHPIGSSFFSMAVNTENVTDNVSLTRFIFFRGKERERKARQKKRWISNTAKLIRFHRTLLFSGSKSVLLFNYYCTVHCGHYAIVSLCLYSTYAIWHIEHY